MVEKAGAWLNSLFEDYAEFVLGMRLAIDKQGEYAAELLQHLQADIGEALVSQILGADESDEGGILQQRSNIQALRDKLKNIDSRAARELESVAENLCRKSVWIIGGDGWAYDIGYGGLDHVLVMVAVGFHGWQCGGRARWLFPAAFLAAMGLGGILAFSGLPLPAVEIGIVVSVLVLGALVAGGRRLPLAVGTGLIALFALFHGHAHGAEAAVGTSLAAYAIGFLAATALLHASGLALGFALRRRPVRFAPT